jgi:hypothetical protein
VKQSGNRLAVVLVGIEGAKDGKTVATGKILYAIGGKAAKWAPKPPTPKAEGSWCGIGAHESIWYASQALSFALSLHGHTTGANE